MLKRTADHHLHRLVTTDLSRRSRADQPSVAQYGDTTGDAIDLLHTVADKYHRDAAGLKTRNNREQPFDFTL